MTDLDPTIKAGIEADLRSYRRWSARMAQIADELHAAAEATGYHTAQVSQKHRRFSDPTWRAVRRREALLREYEDLARRVSRVSNAMMAMTEDQRRLVELYYIDGAPRSEVMNRLGISRRQFYRIRAQALETYAYVAGLVGETSGARNSA